MSPTERGIFLNTLKNIKWFSRVGKIFISHFSFFFRLNFKASLLGGEEEKKIPLHFNLYVLFHYYLVVLWVRDDLSRARKTFCTQLEVGVEEIFFINEKNVFVGLNFLPFACHACLQSTLKRVLIIFYSSKWCVIFSFHSS